MEIDGIRSSAELFREAAEQGDNELGRTQFLELMIAQLESQDPLNPTQNEDFVAQLAQFSSLEGIENLNSTITDMAADLRSGLAVDAAVLVGRNVLAPTSDTRFTGEPVSGQVQLDDGAESVRISISRAGELLETIELGPQAPGRLPFSWNGTTGGGADVPPDSDIRIEASALVEGESRAVEVRLPDRVVSVSLGADGVTVNTAGGANLALREIEEVS